MNYVGLKFILRGVGNFLQIIATPEEAKAMIDGIASGQFKIQGKMWLNGSNQFGTWAIEVGEITAVHTFALPPEASGPMGQPGAMLPQGYSGVPQRRY